MTEQEFEIGRQFGAGAFFVYQTIKQMPNCTARELEIETGLSDSCIQTQLKLLREVGLINNKLMRGSSRTQLYSINVEKVLH